MRSKWFDGALAGVAGGIPFGILMHMMQAPAPDGEPMPMMVMVAAVVRSESLVVGWLYHLFNSAVIGALFGVLVGDRTHSTGGGVSWGLVWGTFWWVLGGLILMPILLGMPVFASLRMAPMRPVALASLAGHLTYGAILGFTYMWLRRSSRMGQLANSA